MSVDEKAGGKRRLPLLRSHRIGSRLGKSRDALNGSETPRVTVVHTHVRNPEQRMWTFAPADYGVVGKVSAMDLLERCEAEMDEPSTEEPSWQ